MRERDWSIMLHSHRPSICLLPLACYSLLWIQVKNLWNGGTYINQKNIDIEMRLINYIKILPYQHTETHSCYIEHAFVYLLALCPSVEIRAFHPEQNILVQKHLHKSILEWNWAIPLFKCGWWAWRQGLSELPQVTFKVIYLGYIYLGKPL